MVSLSPFGRLRVIVVSLSNHRQAQDGCLNESLQVGNHAFGMPWKELGKLSKYKS